MNIIVITCAARREQGLGLAKRLGAMVVCDEHMQGARTAHITALEMASQFRDRCIIIEDDAILCDNFRGSAAMFLQEWPGQLCSLYLGTGKPVQYQAIIARKLIGDPDYVTLPTLIHGLCYSPPVGWMPSGLREDKGVDLAIGDSWGKPVIYANPSLVDHSDGPSLCGGSGKRKAWRFTSHP